jgi:hypothetical protein
MNCKLGVVVLAFALMALIALCAASIVESFRLLEKSAVETSITYKLHFMLVSLLYLLLFTLLALLLAIAITIAAYIAVKVCKEKIIDNSTSFYTKNKILLRVLLE